jgi:hypothetical protein
VEERLDAAEPLYEKVVALARELGDRESVAIGLLNLAMVAIGRESGDGARAMLLEVLAIVTESGSKRLGQSALEVAAGMAAMRSDSDQAARFYGIAEAQTGATGLRRDPGDEAFLVPLIARARTELGAAAFSQAEAAGRALSYDDGIVEVRTWLTRFESTDPRHTNSRSHDRRP